MTAVVLDPLTGDPIRVPRAVPRWLNVNIWMLRACCVVWRGHTYVRRYEMNRLYLGCATCGRETPGWMVRARRPPILPTVRRGLT